MCAIYELFPTCNHLHVSPWQLNLAIINYRRGIQLNGKNSLAQETPMLSDETRQHQNDSKTSKKPNDELFKSKTRKTVQNNMENRMLT